MKTSIYLPDDLAEQVRAHGISISEVTQTALRQAVQAAIIKESIMTDIANVAERLRGTIDQAARGKREGGRRDGIVWAKEYATADELEQLAGLDDSEARFERPHTLLPFAGARDRVLYDSVDIDTEEPYWDGFIDGAGQVWDAVQPLLHGPTTDLSITALDSNGEPRQLRPSRP